MKAMLRLFFETAGMDIPMKSRHRFAFLNSLSKPSRLGMWLHVFLLLPIAMLPVSGHLESTCRAAGKEGLPKTIVDLQPFRGTTSIKIEDARGEESATLINLNPNVNAWYLLELNRRGGAPEKAYHLENAHCEMQRLLLENSNPQGLIIAEKETKHMCDLWGPKSSYGLKQDRQSRDPYTPLCGGKLYLRNPTKGHRTGIETVTDFLRDKVPGGEEIVSFVRDRVFTYLYREKAEETAQLKPTVGGLPHGNTNNAPAPALIDPKQADRMVKPVGLGIEIQESSPNGMVLGTWYAAKDKPGIYVSVIVPNGIAPEIMHSYTKVVNGLNSVELGELVYLIAFDLGQFDLKYTLGTEHPRVGWSQHILDQMKDKALPGPDGIGTIAPLVSTGLINPMDAGRTVATFTGGFKREHGAFKYGPLAIKNHGSHYGFLENGVIFSKLQPDLSTIYVLHDGWADMKTWSEEDNHLLPRVRYARQNGVPIIEGFDQAHRMSVPGALVARWGEGNWSGSADKKLQTMRAGAALQEFQGRRFLIYAFFWSATPSAMARVFQAYQCSYALLLDMNALVHTYLAVYKRQGSNVYVQHLIQGMGEVDMSIKGHHIPRFLAYADDRDFFYLTRKEVP